MRTTAGTYASQTIKTRTLTLADTSGVAVCFGSVNPPELLDEAREALTHMRARWSNRIQIETTHFVCTHPTGPAPAVTPPSESPRETPDPSAEYQRATQLSIPIVQPAWVIACLREKRMVPISAYTLDKTVPSGGASSSTSLSKNAFSKSQTHLPQQPREGPREPIQLQKPPPPKNPSPEVSSAAPMPSAAEPAQPEEVTETAPEPALQETVQEFAPVPAIAPTQMEEPEDAHEEVPEDSPAAEEPVDTEHAPDGAADGAETAKDDNDNVTEGEANTSAPVITETDAMPTDANVDVAAVMPAEEPVANSAEEALEHDNHITGQADNANQAEEVEAAPSPTVEAEISESFQSANAEPQAVSESPSTKETEAEEEEQISATDAVAADAAEDSETPVKSADELPEDKTEVGEAQEDTEALDEVKL